MPSLRPTKPTFSVVVALTLTASSSTNKSLDYISRIAGINGVSLGC